MDVLDIFALIVLAVILAAVVVLVVVLGSLPGAIARKRGHPQADAVNVAGWLGVATFGMLWPLALIWAFLQTSGGVKPGPHESLRADHGVAPLGMPTNDAEQRA